MDYCVRQCARVGISHIFTRVPGWASVSSLLFSCFISNRPRKYLSDPIEDVRIATENLLADFLREIRDVTYVARHLDENGSIRKPENGHLRNDSMESRQLTMTEGNDSSAVDTFSPPEEDVIGQDMTQASPDQYDRGNGGVN